MPAAKKYFLTLLFLVLFPTCSGKRLKTTVNEPQAINKIKCVAIVPLANLSGSAESSSVITDLLVSTVNSKAIFRSVPAGDVERQMDIARIEPQSKISIEDICKLGERLYSEGVLTGSVTEYGYVNQSADFSAPKIGFTLSLYDTKACRLVWNTEVAGSTPGAKGSLSGLAMTSIDESLEHLNKNFTDRVLDFRYRCGPRRIEETSRCKRGKGGWIDFEKCPEAIPYQRFGREKVSIEGDEIIFNDVIHFVPGKSIVAKESRGLLKELVKFLNTNRIRRIRVESYILSGKDQARSLSGLNRAGKVRRYLIRSGLGNTQVDAVNFTINPKLAKDKRISSLRFIVLE